MEAELVEERFARLEKALAAAESNYNECLDTMWMLLATMLVFFMHAGFTLLEAGAVRSKHTQHILSKNLGVLAVGLLCWYVLGYPLAFGEDTGRFAGHSGFALADAYRSTGALRFWLRQGAFCATSVTIVSGAMAERTQVRGFLAYTVVMASFIYPIVVHWGCSGSGILDYEENGARQSLIGPPLVDFAGNGMLHLVGGVGALCGAAIVGPRRGRFESSDVDDAVNVPFVVVGCFFLWFGWFGFSAGSVPDMHDAASAQTAAVVAVNIALAPCASGLVVFLRRHRPSAPSPAEARGFSRGILAGLVSITAGAATVTHWEALLIGCAGGLVYEAASALVRLAGVDDAVDAFAVHGACGLWGLLAPGFFGSLALNGNGILHGGDQLGTQLLAIALAALWAGGLSLPVFGLLRATGLLRYSEDAQAALERDPASVAKACVDPGTPAAASPAGPLGPAPAVLARRPDPEACHAVV